MLTTASLLVVGLSATMAAQQQPQQLRLESLKLDCRLEKRWLGVVPALPWGVFLRCGPTSFLVTHPQNLLLQVKIQTPDQALEFVRFFSNVESYDLFELGGMVEVLPRNGPDPGNFNELDASIFAKHFRPAVARLLKSSRPLGASQEEGCCRGREFEVKRVVLLPDETVREIVEVVSEEGFYSSISREILFKNSNSVGLQYFWPR